MFIAHARIRKNLSVASFELAARELLLQLLTLNSRLQPIDPKRRA